MTDALQSDGQTGLTSVIDELLDVRQAGGGGATARSVVDLVGFAAKKAEQGTQLHEGFPAGLVNCPNSFSSPLRGGVEQRIRRGRALEIVYGYRVKREVLDALDPEDPFYLAPLTGRFTGTAFIDRRDDPFNASRGWFGSFNAERVTEFESNEDAIKVQGTYYRYQAVGPVVLASAARVGGSFLSPLSFSERFFLGGADTVRGYGESLLGPKTFTGSARGGNALLILCLLYTSDAADE